MQKLGLNEIRERYLRFFEGKGHLRLPSFSLVPQDDPSVLLINAGMTPLKPYFTGARRPPSLRVTTCQKCIRTPDIEQVGHTSRHGTFFEMLGNFSFGDYFKAEIIPWAWEFVTQELELDPALLYVTVYREDDEAYRLWTEVVGIDPTHIERRGKEDNFWEHGTGPCGPCSEIFFDRGSEHGDLSFREGLDADSDRYIEFWNLVFTQFDRQEDGSYLPLEKKNIDTGAGLERIACVVQGVDNLFEVDTVRSILNAVCDLAHVRYGEEARTDVAIRVITDHLRSCSMMISDGITPANSGRGYVLRRLLRRAARFGRLLGIEGCFLAGLVPKVIEASGQAYPNLVERQSFIVKVMEAEEEAFAKTIRQGQAMLDEYIAAYKREGQGQLAGAQLFRLHDTYGFPVDLTREILAEEGLGADLEGFAQAMAEQKAMGKKAAEQRGQSAWGDKLLPEELKNMEATDFTGYAQTRDLAPLELILGRNEDGDYLLLDEAPTDMAVTLVLAHTCFYANSGGQVGDRGLLRSLDGAVEVAVEDCTKTAEGVFLLHGQVRRGLLRRGQELEQLVDQAVRLATARNHSTTHLLHKALRDCLGDHVSQAGSLVSPERLRFDFRHFQAMTAEELATVEAAVNRVILQDLPLQTAVMSLEEAKQSGAMALFDEKYGERVRVVSIGDYSMEFCGGTHLERSSQAGLFKILTESSVASGVRRIEAVTGAAAYDYTVKEEALIHEACSLLRSTKGELLQRLGQLQKEVKQLEQERRHLEAQQTAQAAAQLIGQAEKHQGLSVLAAEVQVENREALRDLADQLRDKLQPAAVLLATELEGKLAFIAVSSKEAQAAGLAAGTLVKAAATAAGGGGGGRPDMAQAGAKDCQKLPQALEAVWTLLRQ